MVQHGSLHERNPSLDIRGELKSLEDERKDGNFKDVKEVLKGCMLTCLRSPQVIT